MSKAKLLIVACFATFIVGGIASATASAGEWMVNGKNLEGEASIAPVVNVIKKGELKILGANALTIKCEGNTIEVNGGKIISPDRVLVSSIGFKECVGEGECTGIAEGKQIKTVPLHGLASLDGSLAAYVLVLPETKTVLATIGFTNEKCALFPSQPVTGDASLLAPEGKDERTVQVVNAFSLPKALKVGSAEGDLIGAQGEVKLESGLPWSFL